MFRGGIWAGPMLRGATLREFVYIDNIGHGNGNGMMRVRGGTYMIHFAYSLSVAGSGRFV